jgi:ABC-type antimicrobial peptide transport system permease subunit
MFFLQGIWNGLGEIRAHKLRSALTITCVMLGVASLVLIAGFISGLFYNWETYQREFGFNERISVYETAAPDTDPKIRQPGTTLEDARALQAMCRHAVAVAAESGAPGQLCFNGKTADVNVAGATPGELEVSKNHVDFGRFITDRDVDNAEPVIVLGSVPVKQLFRGQANPLGRIVTVGQQPFRIVGLLREHHETQGNSWMSRYKNDVAFIPVTAAQTRLGASGQLGELTIKVDDTKNLGLLVDEATSVLLRTHRGVHDFRFRNPQANIEEESAMRRNFYAAGCGIGAITLLVGGIGIMNLMLASINERVREIGIRKAIGAWNRDIFVQFIAEAIALSTLGGIVGVAVGVLAIRALRNAMAGGDNPAPVLSIPAMLIGLGFSIFIGVVAGLYPAFRASRLDPIEALRYE